MAYFTFIPRALRIGWGALLDGGQWMDMTSVPEWVKGARGNMIRRYKLRRDYGRGG